jgi:membrane peptidoglycan carboxypeptidase
MSQAPPPYGPRRASRYAAQRTSTRKWRWVGWVTLVTVLLTSGVLTYLWWTVRDLPDPGQTQILGGSIYIYDRNGRQIELRNSNGQYYVRLSLQQMGKWGPVATLAAEDRNFYNHGPVDFGATTRAIGSDLLHRGATQGGSTISQQLVKISLLTPQRSIFRKMQEAVLAQALENKYSKSRILEMYLNRVNYGHNAYGLGAATRVYFGAGKNTGELTPGQASFLAGLINGPAYYDPALYFDRAKQRQLYVLDGMVKMGALTRQEADQAAQENIQAELKYDLSFIRSQAPHFVNYVLGQLEKTVGPDVVQKGGLAVYTTLDLDLQARAQQAVANGVAALRSTGVNNGDLLAANPKTGEILAWVGSADFYNNAIGGQVDVIERPRQPGSSFKPYVFEAALKDPNPKITLSTTLQDRPTTFQPGNYRPVDFDNAFMGNMSARRALVLSRNVPAVEVGQQEGIQNVVDLAHSMGIKSHLNAYPSTAIGTSELTMLEHLQGYQTFADQGTLMPLMSITKVMDAQGAPLWQQVPGQQPGVSHPITPADAYLITDTLKAYQTQWSLGWRRQMAGKSGTTSGADTGSSHRDAWMMAYNPDIVVGAWAGNTAAGGGGKTISTFGTQVGQRVLAPFINGLPQNMKDWYQQPQGIVTGNGCGGGGREIYLANTQQAIGCTAPTATPAPTQTTRPTQAPTAPPTAPPTGPVQIPTATPSPAG